jgi:ComF family protein
MPDALSTISLAFELLASMVAPPRCAACDARCDRTAAFCPPCASSVERERSDDPASIAAFVYGGAVADAIARMKYHRRPDLARPLGELLGGAVAARAVALRDAVAVPVPLHASRLAERGFNQSAIIARGVSRRLNIPLLPRALVRVRDTPQQAALDREQRIANVAGAFRARPSASIAGRTVVLVDDVRTTGATIDACAGVLASAGATSIVHAVVARVRADGMLRRIA